MPRSEKAPSVINLENTLKVRLSPQDRESDLEELELSILSTGCSACTGGTTHEPHSCLLDACMLQRSNPRISKSTDHLHKVLQSDKCSPKTSTVADNLPNVSMVNNCLSNACKTTNRPPNVFMFADYLPKVSRSTEYFRNVPALTHQCPKNKMESHRYHSTSVSSIGSITLPSISRMLNHCPRKWCDDESSPSLNVLNRPLFGHGLPPDNHLQNLDHAEAPAPYVLTFPHHPIPASQLSIVCNLVYCAAKRTDDDGSCTPFHHNLQGAGKRSDDASTAIYQSLLSGET